MIFFWAQAVGFQALWFSAVLGQNQWLFVGVTLLILSVATSPMRREDLKLWPLALLGFAGDIGLSLAGLFQFDQPPLWLATIWLGFVFTLNHSMRWLTSLPLLGQAAIGALSGTLSYMAGHRLGAVELPYGQWLSAMVLATYWAALLPSLLFISHRLNMVKSS
jgi:hypothetical protein